MDTIFWLGKKIDIRAPIFAQIFHRGESLICKDTFGES